MYETDSALLFCRFIALSMLREVSKRAGHVYNMKDKPLYGSEKELLTCMFFFLLYTVGGEIRTQLSLQFWLLGL